MTVQTSNDLKWVITANNMLVHFLQHIIWTMILSAYILYEMLLLGIFMQKCIWLFSIHLKVIPFLCLLDSETLVNIAPIW